MMQIILCFLLFNAVGVTLSKRNLP